MNDISHDLEQRLRRIEPRRVSSAMHGAVGRELIASPRPRDWPMLCAMGSGLAAACVIAAMLVEQTPAKAPGSSAQRISASSPQDPPAIYAFSFANHSWLNESRRMR